MNSSTTTAIEHGRVIVIVPAHNEAQQIESTVQSLQQQTRPVNMILVVADNCSDNTAELARAMGVQTIETNGNLHKKAGALNYALALLRKGDRYPEYIVTIDADTILHESFVERAVHLLEHNPKLGGVSAVCRGKRGLGSNPYQRALAWLQQAEYARAGVTRLRFNIHALSGAGSILRAQAVLDVIRDRGFLYAERANNLVEDYEATLEIKRHGWECTNNYHCVAYTDLMLSLRSLLKQRIRWIRGSIDELRLRGWQPETKFSIMTLVYAMLIMPLFYGWTWLLAKTLLTHRISGMTLVFLAMFGLYQAITAKALGWKGMLASFLMLPELLFNFVRHIWLISSVVQSYTSHNHAWE